jgi:hypothetical protein
MKKLSKLLLLLTIATPCFAQNARKDDIAVVAVTQLTSLGNVTVLKPVASATITIGLGNNSCSVTNTTSGSTASCTPLAALCSSSSDAACIQTNPTNADINGNYGFWAKPGRYQVAISGIGINGKVITYDLLSGMTDTTNLVDLAGGLSASPITTSSLVASALSAGSITDTGLPTGLCVQTTTGGLFTTSSGPCGTSTGTVTATGSPVSGQGSFFTSAASITGSANWTYSAGSGHSVVQGANGTDALFMARFTDSSPTGYFLQFQNAARNTDLFDVDITGNMVAGTVPWARLTAFPSGCAANSYVSIISTTPTCLQPSFSGLIGNISVSQMNSGSGASSTTFWRGDGTWSSPSASGASTGCTAIGPVTVTNTAVSTNLLSCTLGAGALSAGSLLEIDVSSSESTAASGSITVTLSIGGASVCETQVTAGIANNQPWNLIGKYFVITSGASGTAMLSCQWVSSTAGGGLIGPFGTTGTPTQSVNTTVTNLIQITVQMGVANVGNTIIGEGLKAVIF